ncbi:MAG: hypothetical protein GY847_40130 [Proteobacteria bacterium]|nr:hypothetical protein [Pseudomonadota bacterium]
MPKVITVGAHRLIHLFMRAVDGIRRRPWLHLLSLFTLTAAFLSFLATLTAALNLDNLLARWVGSAEMTAYLVEDASENELGRLKEAISGIDGVYRVETVAPFDARTRFVNELGVFGDMARTLPEAVFPASIEIHLNGALSRNPEARRALASRLEKVEMIEEVELYDDWFERLSALTLIGRLATWGLGLIAFAVAILVVTAVVRAGVNARSREIEVLGLIGATRRYVRFPFLLEGAIEATSAMLLALAALHFLNNSVQELAGELMPLIGAAEFMRLTPTAVLMLLAGSALVGLAGAGISLRGLVRV